MTIGIYLLILGAICFVSGTMQMIPKIFIFIGLMIILVGLIITTVKEAIIITRLEELEDKVKKLEKLKESIEYGNEVCKNCQDDKDKGLKQAKKKVAREIFEQIDILGTYNPKLYAELKKKYIDGERRKEDAEIH